MAKSFELVVQTPFGSYQVGDEILDDKEIDEILAEHPAKVVKRARTENKE